MFGVLNPIQSAYSIVTSTNLADSDGGLAAIANTHSYAVGDKVFDTTNTPHEIYQCTTAYTSGSPATKPSADATHWQLVSWTNPNKPFDTSSTTQSQSPSAGAILQWVFTPGQNVGWIYLEGLRNIATVTATAVDVATGATIYARTNALPLAPAAADYYSYAFGQPFRPSATFFDDLPANPNITVTITCTPVAATTGYVGTIIMGQPVMFGTNTRFGTRVGLTDYSYVNTNAYGDVTLVPRMYSRPVDFSVYLRRGELDSAYRFLASLRAVPTLFWGGDTLSDDSLKVFGFFKTLEQIINYENMIQCNLTVQGIAQNFA